MNEDFYDCLILDVVLPDIDGLKILEKIKENILDIPAVMISGYGDIDIA